MHCGFLLLFVTEKESAAAANVEEVCWVYVKQVSQYMCGQPFDCTSRVVRCKDGVSEIVTVASVWSGRRRAVSFSFFLITHFTCTLQIWCSV